MGIICGSFVCASVEDYKCPLRLMKENVCELRKDIVTHREEIIENYFKVYNLYLGNVMHGNRKLRKKICMKADPKDISKLLKDADRKSVESLSMITARILVTVLDKISLLSTHWNQGIQEFFWAQRWKSEMLDPYMYVENFWCYPNSTLATLEDIILGLNYYFPRKLESEKKMFFILKEISEDINWIFKALKNNNDPDKVD